MVKSAGIKNVGFYCGNITLLLLVPCLRGKGTILTSMTVTSRGRGNRAAAWFQDYLEEKKDLTVRSAAVSEGILGWALAGSQYTQYIEEFEPEAWKVGDASKHVGQLKQV